MTLGVALGVLLAWLMLTIGLGTLVSDGGHHSLGAEAAAGIGLPWLAAACFALCVAWRAGPAATGLQWPSPAGAWRLAWLSAVYAALMLAFDVAQGLPAHEVLLVVAVNMLLVAVSEELMFRGILFHALWGRYRLWPAIVLTSLAFGLVHTFNGFGTGRWDQAVMQSIAAFMQGFAYLAIRIRTRSVWPMVLVHAAWDYSLMLGVLAQPVTSGAATVWSALPLLVVLPVFLYGLFLLRGITSRLAAPDHGRAGP